MAKKIIELSWKEVHHLARKLANHIKQCVPTQIGVPMQIYGVPRGGIHVAQLLMSYGSNAFEIVESPALADVFVDDLVDSGATRAQCLKEFNVGFYTLITGNEKDVWYSFPWERMKGEQGPEENVRRVLEYIGEDPNREGLLETPSRVVRSWGELFSGYKTDPATILKSFADGACDEMVVLRDVEFYSFCEHHMLPFFGKAHIGYLPNGRVVGISKLARLLDVYTRRLQIQERIGQQITDAIMEQLGAKGAGCILEAKHHCMTCRGVGKQNSVMMTSSLRGVFKDSALPRAEFLKMAGL